MGEPGQAGVRHLQGRRSAQEDRLQQEAARSAAGLQVHPHQGRHPEAIRGGR